ncbi:3-methyl-2-oxobutanoate hydroxymethyltransferase [Fictibacillus terranigra]|uniref:3-methyl-2-oxobutanoate hydroxymethyltransferase n=1 Tax=Fictibacillus terranigra TaxID=3058424 RepID=A0ABT8E9E8_9BACL|nr:3-methyl-2-oxobutanoate hydroxymethyltransferase [Fictibacillus sp. CENA-BCM004]MDN4074537.1 3-methyl-2-oxobutanoate hydroxymethyltransferase [Fictibacillus sp. CENA-BCM004]
MKTTQSFIAMKQQSEKIAMITAYDYPSAQLAEQAEVDMILVGDSLGMVVLGYDSTVPVTVEDMIHHARAVKRGAPNTFIVTDMPFMSYHAGRAETVKNAMRIMQETGSHALKLEGGKSVIETIGFLVEAGVPIVGHLGLTPQTAGVLGGYKVQGRAAKEAKQLLQDALAIEAAGAFSLVLECVPKQLSQLVAESVKIPVIGIGAGSSADGQVLVYHDLVGYGFHHVPKFVKMYAHCAEGMKKGIEGYIAEVKKGTFPAEEHSFTMKPEEAEALYGGK